MDGRTLCLNVTYEPLGFLSKERAAVILLDGKAECLEEGERSFNSNSGVVVPEPLVVRLNRYIKMPKQSKEGVTSRVLFARDHWTCQYCGKHARELKGKNNRLTIDHIKPRAQGGKHTWENVVTACYICNIKKRDRTPMQANMNFVSQYKNRAPKRPHLLVFTYGGKVTPEQAKWIKSFYGVTSLDQDVDWNIGQPEDPGDLDNERF